jgi:hypothetical protein
MSYPRDRRVDAYIDALPDWQQDICILEPRPADRGRARFGDLLGQRSDRRVSQNARPSSRLPVPQRRVAAL